MRRPSAWPVRDQLAFPSVPPSPLPLAPPPATIPIVCSEDDQCFFKQPQVPQGRYQCPHSRIQLHQGVPERPAA